MEIKSEPIKIAGINRIIFEYCHFPPLFENELLHKTECIYKKLRRTNNLSPYYVINNANNWVIRGSGYLTPKYYSLCLLQYRQNKYREIIGLKPEKIQLVIHFL